MRSSWSCGSGRGAPRPPPWGEARWRGAVVGVGRAAESARRVSGGQRGRRILDSKARLQEWEEEQLGGIGATGGGSGGGGGACAMAVQCQATAGMGGGAQP
jgi:hypothetical protein